MTEDVLTDGKGECVICLEELQSGDLIARLPCLCIYHKKYVSWCHLSVTFFLFLPDKNFISNKHLFVIASKIIIRKIYNITKLQKCY